MMQISPQQQDAILSLSEVEELNHLNDALLDCLHLSFPKLVDSLVFSTDIFGGNDEGKETLISSKNILHVLPNHGLLSDVVKSKKRQIVDSLSISDPLSNVLVSKSDYSQTSNGCFRIVCSPIIDLNTDKVISAYVIILSQLAEDDLQILSFIEKQFLICRRNLRNNYEKQLRSQRDSRIISLCGDLFDQDAPSLQKKIINYLVVETESEGGFILLIDRDRHELFCQVICEEILENEIRIPIWDNAFASIIEKKISAYFTSDDLIRLSELTSHLKGPIKSSLCVPIACRKSGVLLAITCIYNKIDNQVYCEVDEKIVKHCFIFTVPVLHSTIAIQNERIFRNQTQVLLQVAQNLFTHLGDLPQLLMEIMQEARNLTQAERCSVFLLDRETNELVAKVFDGDGSRKDINNREVRIPSDKGIAGHVATTGELLNIDDTYSHELFYRGVDEATGFKTRNILCFPIKDDQEVIGVAQLCNKLNGSKFSQYDENVAQAFSVLCCISIVHSLLYKKATDSQHRSKLSNELMIYHMQVAREDVLALSSSFMHPLSAYHKDFSKYSFIPRKISTDAMPHAIITMFSDLEFISKHRIRMDCLAKFVLMVKKGYRDPPYHNWSHAFSVAHFCFLLFKNTEILTCLNDVEALSLFVSCLCHDIDHRGTTNSFQVASGSVLAALYSSEGSVLERHHFAQTLCILNTDGCNIFQNLSREEYRNALDLVQAIILATDLAQHLKKEESLKYMAKNFDQKNREHRVLLLSLCMTACDLSDQTKGFQNSKAIAERIYTEFFSQGDLEKRIGRDPMEMMDREKAIIPDLQISFLNTIALPVYRTLATVLPETIEVLDAAENNAKQWIKLNETLQTLNLPRNMDMFYCNLDPSEQPQVNHHIYPP